MGFMDLKFGWHHENFDLYDVELLCSIELQQLDDDGAWEKREPFFLGFFSDTEERKNKENIEYENPKSIKYTNSKRTLIAKAKYSDGSYNDIFLGVPEDKQHTTSREAKIKYFDFFLRETDIDDLDKIVKSGSFGFIEDDSELQIKGGPYAEFYAPSNVFDHIEKLCSKTNIQLNVSINKKGWQWTGPIGDGQIYLDTKNRELAEFAGITFSNKLAKFEKEALQEENPLIEGDYSQDALEANMHIFNKLTELGGYIASVKFAVWVVALGVIFLAVRSY